MRADYVGVKACRARHHLEGDCGDRRCCTAAGTASPRMLERACGRCAPGGEAWQSQRGLAGCSLCCWGQRGAGGVAAAPAAAAEVFCGLPRRPDALQLTRPVTNAPDSGNQATSTEQTRACAAWPLEGGHPYLWETLTKSQSSAHSQQTPSGQLCSLIKSSNHCISCSIFRGWVLALTCTLRVRRPLPGTRCWWSHCVSLRSPWSQNTDKSDGPRSGLFQSPRSASCWAGYPTGLHGPCMDNGPLRLGVALFHSPSEAQRNSAQAMLRIQPLWRFSERLSVSSVA